MIQHEAQKKGAAANREKARPRDLIVLGLIAGGKSYAQIAEVLDVKPDNVRTIVLRARQRLALKMAASARGYGVVRVGQRPAGPMADRRTKRNRSRGAREQSALADQ